MAARAPTLHEAQATYDGAVATYRQTVPTAFQNVEEPLFAQSPAGAGERVRRHLSPQPAALRKPASTIPRRHDERTKPVDPAAYAALAAQSLKDTQARWIQSSVTLIRNLGGSQWHDTKQASANPGGPGMSSHWVPLNPTDSRTRFARTVAVHNALPHSAHQAATCAAAAAITMRQELLGHKNGNSHDALSAAELAELLCAIKLIQTGSSSPARARPVACGNVSSTASITRRRRTKARSLS